MRRGYIIYVSFQEATFVADVLIRHGWEHVGESLPGAEDRLRWSGYTATLYGGNFTVHGPGTQVLSPSTYNYADVVKAYESSANRLRSMTAAFNSYPLMRYWRDHG